MGCVTPLVWGGVENLCESQFMNYLGSTPSNETSPTTILDSVATGNFLPFDAACVRKQIDVAPIKVKLHNGDIIRSTHNTTINIPALPITVREAHIFPRNFQHSLLSIGRLCDNSCEVNFLARNVTVKIYGDAVLVGQREC
jgi:hypothetical protein